MISPSGNFAAFFEPDRDGLIAIPVGNKEGKQLLIEGLKAAKRDKRKLIESGVNLLWYMICHPGAFATIGGAIAVGTCGPQARSFSWPVIEIGGYRFLRGLDVTQSYRPSWPPPVVITYDESWCSQIDQDVATKFQSSDQIVSGYTRYDIDTWFTPETLFQTHDDPAGFEGGLPRNKRA